MNYCVMCKLFYLYCKVESSSFIIVIRMVIIGVINACFPLLHVMG